MSTHNPLVFFKEFLSHPVAVGAVLPTSIQTARIMASPIKADGLTLEMGAGTGSITEGLMERLKHPGLLTSVEIDEKLAQEFKKNFPNVNLFIGDVEKVLETPTTYDSIVSGVPLSVMNTEKKNRIYDLIMKRLNPEGVFVAIQYSLVSKKELSERFESVEIKFSPINVPPAFVYVCRKPKI